MSTPQRAVAVLVAVLIVVGGAVLVLNLGRGGGVATASQSPAPTGSGLAAETASAGGSATAGATPQSDEEVLAVLAEIEQQVEAIRGLEPANIGPAELITREELRGELQEIFDEEYPPDERERDNLALRAFGLLEPDEDVAELQLELLGEGVLGFYDDVEKRMVVVTDTGLDATAKVTYAHEYAHALQDAAFGLATLETDAVGEDDRGLARTALIEGDANATMLTWLFRHMTEEELFELQQAPIPDSSGIPSWMVAQLEFPYTFGQAWVMHVLGFPGGSVIPGQEPNFRAVDAAFADPPSSTEQIIHPELWDSREEPIPVELPDLAAALGSEWEEVDTSPVGEATIAIILEFFGATPTDAGTAAEGWGGDRATVASGPAGEFALAWRLAWDTPEDATEFIEPYQEVVDTLGFEASVRQLPDGHVLVVHASSREIHDATVAAIGE